MDASDVAGNREPKPGRARILVARVVKPIEGAEHVLALSLGDARAVVFDGDGERAILALGGDLDVLGEARGVVDEIGNRALESMPAQRHDQRSVIDLDRDVLGAVSLRFHLAQDVADIDAHDLLGRASFGEGHIVFEHRLHLVDIAAQRLELGTVLEQSELQAKARQHGAEVVTYAGQHDRPLLDMALDTIAHLDEGIGGLAHLACPARAEVVWRRAPLAEALGRLRQAQDRLDLVA